MAFRCCYDFGPSVPDMSARKRRNSRSSCDNETFRRTDAQVQHFRHGRCVDGDYDFDDSKSLPFRPPTSDNTLSAPVTVNDYIAEFQSFLNARLFVLMHQNSDQIYFVNALLSVSYDNALVA